MKKKGVIITLGTVVGTIAGIIIVFILFGVTIKFLTLNKDTGCPNTGQWEDTKEGLKEVEKGKKLTFFFKNEGCYLRIVPPIKYPSELSICLYGGDEDGNCYYFKEIKSFSDLDILGNKLYDTRDYEEEGYTNLFITFQKYEDAVMISTIPRLAPKKIAAEEFGYVT